MRAPLKICGLTDPADARFCAEAGAAAIGAVFHPPSPRNVTPDRAAELFREIPDDVARVGVFADASETDILCTAERVGLTVIQLHGDEPPELVAALLSSGLRVLKALRGGDLAAEAARFPKETLFLVECGRGALPGGNGATWNWEAARVLLPRPFAIAGGLRPDNLALAAAASGAVFFDISSAVESAPGRKDRSRILAAISAAGPLPGDPDFLNGTPAVIHHQPPTTHLP